LLLASGKRLKSSSFGKCYEVGTPEPRYWDLTKGDLKSPPIELSKEKADCVVVSPDSTTVALAQDHDVVLINLATKKELQRLKGHKSYIHNLAFSPDGRLLVSTSADLTALVWAVGR
jgi:WD40 repeat protein